MRLSCRIVAAATGGLLAATGSLALPGLDASPAEAQFWWGGDPPPGARNRSRSGRAKVPKRDVTRLDRSSDRTPGASRSGMPKPTPEEIAASKATASGPLIVTVSIASQRMTVYDANGPIIRGPVSTGKAGHPTPKGVFSIIQKNRHHRSNIYSGAPMPYMQRITWSGIALHAGALPGYPASAGCIRMTYPIAAKLFAISRMGMRVAIGNQEPVVSAFSHPDLPEPLMVAVPPAGETRADGEEAVPNVRVATTEGGAAVATRFLNPMQHAALERTRARERVTTAQRANKELLEASLRASAEANAAAAAMKAAQSALPALKARAAAASEETRAQLEAQVAEAERRLAELTDAEAERNKAAYAAARASRDAEDEQAAAEEAARVAERGTEPIAVFISRREGRVFVRQGQIPLFEAPVTFKEPNRPIGTHVYQVMSADNSTGRLGWKVVSVPESHSFGESLENRGPVRRGERTVQSVGTPSDANGALERVEMSPEVKKKLSERLWLNGSIIISDQGISNETGRGTDFIVLTR